MGFGSKPSYTPPATTIPTPPPAPAPQVVDQAVQQAGTDERSKAAMAYGSGQTILTGPMGLQDKPSTTAKSILGG